MDETRQPSPDALAAELVRNAPGPLSVHVVTEAGLAIALAAVGEARQRVSLPLSIRLEHAFLCDPDAARMIGASGVDIGAHPGFIRSQGTRLAHALSPEEQSHYLPLRTWMETGIRLYGGTDAPFGTRFIWDAMQAAVDRESTGGDVLNLPERLSPEQAFALFTRTGLHHDAAIPIVEEGDRADLCVLDRPWASARSHLREVNVTSTLRSGQALPFA